MILQRLRVTQLRNLEAVDVNLSPGLNVLYGLNGAGKTSLLESIHFLSQARSFKARNPRHLINHEAEAFVVNGDILDSERVVHVGISRSKEGTEARINGNKVVRPSQLAESLPVLVIHPGSFSLLVGARAEKRAFLDWGAFYGERRFREQWSTFQKALKQRNAAIKSRMHRRVISCWDEPLATAAEAVSRYRQQFLDRVIAEVPALTATFSTETSLAVSYARGWPTDKLLLDHLADTLDADMDRGYTSAGPQRGSFEVRLNGHPIGDVGSRGQIKVATIVFKLAQLKVFQEEALGECVLLLDDLDSELDSQNLARFLDVVAALGVQTVLSTLSPDRVRKSAGDDLRLFHVEHGRVKQVL